MDAVLSGKWNYSVESYDGPPDVSSCVKVYSDAGACRENYIGYLRDSFHTICNTKRLFGLDLPLADALNRKKKYAYDI